MKKAIFCWSGGKDSAYALHQVLQAGEYEVNYLLNPYNFTINIKTVNPQILLEGRNLRIKDIQN